MAKQRSALWELLEFVTKQTLDPLDSKYEPQLFALDLAAGFECTKASIPLLDLVWRPGAAVLPGTKLQYWREIPANYANPLVRECDIPPDDFRERIVLIQNETWLSWLRAACHLVESKKPVRPPNAKRMARLAKIELLTKELREHVRAARDYAVDARDRTGEAKLLPRPKQAELANSTGLSTSDVSRCLNDPDALELSLLWRTACDLDALMRWAPVDDTQLDA